MCSSLMETLMESSYGFGFRAEGLGAKQNLERLRLEATSLVRQVREAKTCTDLPKPLNSGTLIQNKDP